MSEYVSITQFVNSCVNEINEREAERLADRLNELGYVKVVRCRNCKHYEKLSDDKGVCHPLGIVFADIDDGFCAWAEPKEGGDD